MGVFEDAGDEDIEEELLVFGYVALELVRCGPFNQGQFKVLELVAPGPQGE